MKHALSTKTRNALKLALSSDGASIICCSRREFPVIRDRLHAAGLRVESLILARAIWTVSVATPSPDRAPLTFVEADLGGARDAESMALPTNNKSPGGPTVRVGVIL